MAGLQRSAQTFRRSGSSGLVWDARFLTEDAEAKAGNSGEEPQSELRHSQSVGSVGMMRCGGDDDKKQRQMHQKQGQDGGNQVFRTKDVPPAVDPPSPKVSGCILCTIFRSSSSGSRSVPQGAKPRKQ